MWCAATEHEPTHAACRGGAAAAAPPLRCGRGLGRPGGAARDLQRPAMVRGRPRTRCLGRRRWTRRLGRGILTIGSHAEVATASAGNEFMVCVMICV